MSVDRSLLSSFSSSLSGFSFSPRPRPRWSVKRSVLDACVAWLHVGALSCSPDVRQTVHAPSVRSGDVLFGGADRALQNEPPSGAAGAVAVVLTGRCVRAAGMSTGRRLATASQNTLRAGRPYPFVLLFFLDGQKTPSLSRSFGWPRPCPHRAPPLCASVHCSAAPLDDVCCVDHHATVCVVHELGPWAKKWCEQGSGGGCLLPLPSFLLLALSLARSRLVSRALSLPVSARTDSRSHRRSSHSR